MSPFRSLSWFVEACRLPPAVVPVVSLSAHAVIDGRLALADCATRAFCWLKGGLAPLGFGRGAGPGLPKPPSGNGSLGRMGIFILDPQGRRLIFPCYPCAWRGYAPTNR